MAGASADPDRAGVGRDWAQPADFAQPLALLHACHGRVMAHNEMLEWLARHLSVHECDAEAQQAASYVLRYFDGAGRHHHEDEDIDLFPRMRQAAQGQNAERVALLVAQLTAEHQVLEREWNGMRERLELIAHGERALLREQEVARFCNLYRAHIAAEEAQVYPLAAVILDREHMTAIGMAMAARRGVRWP